MPSGRLYKTEGIILKTAPVGEGALLVTLVAEDGSKLRAMAYGARKLTSRKMGHLETLTRVELALSKGRSMDTINQVHGVESFTALRGSLESTAKAFYLAELMDGFAVEGSANPSLYNLFLDTLRKVQGTEEDNVSLLRFQLSLLRVNGFMPELYRCVECRIQIPPGDHRFTVNLGGVLCSRCVPAGGVIAPLSLQALKVLRHFHRSAELDASRLRISSSLYEEISSILDGAIRFWLDKDLRSRKFVDQVERQKARMSALKP